MLPLEMKSDVHIVCDPDRRQEYARATMQLSFDLSAAERPKDPTQDAVCVEELK
jgi:hypothetical protein